MLMIKSLVTYSDIALQFSDYFYLSLYLCWVLVEACRIFHLEKGSPGEGMLDAQLPHVGSSPLTRDGTWAPALGAES